jgi:hypothetical protein
MSTEPQVIERTPEQAQQPAPPSPPPTDKLATLDNRPPEIQKFEFQQRSARLFAMSGLFADIKGQTVEQSLAQAFVKIALGDSMGFSPAEAMTGIDIIQGRVSVGSSLRAARMQRAGYDWDILQLDDKGCRLRLKLNGRPLMQEEIDGETGEVTEVPVIISFTAEDAARANLLGKDNYKKNPRNMFFARAITNAQRWFAPGVLGVDILSREEALDLDPLPSAPIPTREALPAELKRKSETEAIPQQPSSPETGTATAASTVSQSQPAEAQNSTDKSISTSETVLPSETKTPTQAGSTSPKEGLFEAPNPFANETKRGGRR